MSALMRMPSYDTADDSWSNRRMFPRKEVHETVEGRRLDHTIEARQQPRLNLMLRVYFVPERGIHRPSREQVKDSLQRCFPRVIHADFILVVAVGIERNVDDAGVCLDQLLMQQ